MVKSIYAFKKMKKKPIVRKKERHACQTAFALTYKKIGNDG